MSNYTKSTNFATKDALASGNPLKIVKGTEIDTFTYELTMVGKEKVTSGKATLLATIKYKCPEGERVVQYPRHANLSFEMK